MFKQIMQDVAAIKEMQGDSNYRMQQVVNTEFKRRNRVEVQDEGLNGIYLATVVDTQDPLGQGRVRFYSPYLDNGIDDEKTTDLHGLPWASPVSSFGGFDDSGSIWVPPAGSKVVVFFLNGFRDAAFYLGTVWNRSRGTGSHLDYWNYPVAEYECLWEGRRNGYLFGSNAGDQVFPPWHNEMYNGYDTDSIIDFYSDANQHNATTYPHIKGFKTEEKHMLKFVDGDPKCNKRYKRVELASGRGNWLMFKDDPLHTCGQWAFGGMPGLAFCHQSDVPKEFPCCDSGKPQKCLPPGCAPKACPEQSQTDGSVNRFDKFQNPFFNRLEEMRPYWGANTPQANACELEQSGAQLQSISGHQIVLDDSVNQPTGVPTWDRDFDFGCDDTFRGKMWMKSATGHKFEINDQEDIGFSSIRGEENGFNFRTASGNFFEMSDHTTGENCEPKFAGERSGFTMMSRSTHLFQMNDNHLKQFSPIRMEGGIPKKADEAGFEGYVLLRSGYGLQLLMKDDDRQDKTENQFIQLMAPQIDNTERGPHMLVMQEAKSGPGLVMMRSGGVYYQASYDETIEVTGTDPDNPASRFSSVTDNWLIDVKNIYFNHNKMTIQWAEEYIFLLAGRDCPSPDDETASESESQGSTDIENAQGNPGSSEGKSEGSPCIYNAITSKDPWVCPFTGYVHYGVMANGDGDIVLDSRSERVFVSAGKPAGSEDSEDSEGSEDE
jgi:hypothetical protein